MKKVISVMLCFCLLLSGCASYNASRLPSKDPFSFANYQQKDGLIMAAQFLSASDSKKVFGVSNLYKKFQPVYITIENKTGETYDFKKSMLNKRTTSAEEVAEICKFNTAGRATTYGVAGLFLWPLLIPAVVDGVGSSNANSKMQDDFAFKEIRDDRIQPNGMLSGVVFLEKMKDGETLDIRLQNVGDNNIALFTFQK
ncbi:MAG: hypothetical protein PHQ52_03135 [Candidatus Omnitrophica bacterium]|nr:hypothetical protein [Candidatus Omnitrophota bacterium]